MAIAPASDGSQVRPLPGIAQMRENAACAAALLKALMRWWLPAAVLCVACAPRAANAPSSEPGFKLESSLLVPNGALSAEQAYDRLGCGGRNVSPPLRWSGAPAGTRSFALTMYDPDARGGKGWWHWAVYDIPASSSGLPQSAGNPGGALPPPALQARIDFGFAGYGGPCPPAGDKRHHYVFTVYALKTERLDLPAGSPVRTLSDAIEANQLAAASLTGTYGR
ncbi:MAG TPA: YbhB/YbcL family Raf kinase inhibitor-like protein [Steroidobacteraceae bacterium]|nr:YbhB/YbcL family Raf kinase inhibitor-like protein [Steroidobacteraceae bacterium]